jgi:hypothetical protein
MKLIVNWISCMAAILLMAYLMPTRVRYDGYLAIVAAGTLLWLINTLVRPILRIISFPITILTLGLFSLTQYAYGHAGRFSDANGDFWWLLAKLCTRNSGFNHSNGS